MQFFLKRSCILLCLIFTSCTEQVDRVESVADSYVGGYDYAKRVADAGETPNCGQMKGDQLQKFVAFEGCRAYLAQHIESKDEHSFHDDEWKTDGDDWSEDQPIEKDIKKCMRQGVPKEYLAECLKLQTEKDIDSSDEGFETDDSEFSDEF